MNKTTANHHAHRRPRRNPMVAAPVPHPNVNKSAPAAPSASNPPRAEGLNVNIQSVNRVGWSSATPTVQAINVAANKNPATMDTTFGRFGVVPTLVSVSNDLRYPLYRHRQLQNPDDPPRSPERSNQNDSFMCPVCVSELVVGLGRASAAPADRGMLVDHVHRREIRSVAALFPFDLEYRAPRRTLT